MEGVSRIRKEWCRWMHEVGSVKREVMGVLILCTTYSNDKILCV